MLALGQSGEGQMYISIIIPVCNEEENIGALYREIKKCFLNYRNQYELIFVNDGSSDNSLNILKDMMHEDSSVRVISFDWNYGKTSALDAGFKNARGEIILTIDCDLQYDPKDLRAIFKELENINNDAILGRRINRTSGCIKNACSRVAVFIRNRVLGENYQGCYLAGYKKRCLKNLVLYRGFQDFIPSLLRSEGYHVKEIDVKESPRRHGRSKYGIRNRFFKGLLALLVMKWMKVNRLRYKAVEVEREKSRSSQK